MGLCAFQGAFMQARERAHTGPGNYFCGEAPTRELKRQQAALSTPLEIFQCSIRLFLKFNLELSNFLAAGGFILTTI